MISRRVLALIASLVVLLVLVLAGFASSARATPAASRSTVYTDPVGDSQGAPDISKIEISNDATGALTIAITANGWSDFFLGSVSSGAHVLMVALDTDHNSATGASGVDYIFSTITTSDGLQIFFERWDGSQWQDAPHGTDTRFLLGSDTATYLISSADLGGTTSFTFKALVSIMDDSGNATSSDFAPDAGSFAYVLSTTPPPTTTTTAPPTTPTTPAPSVKPIIAKPVISPARATAGKRLTVSFHVARSDNGKPLTNGKMICDPSVNGKVIRHAESFRGGTARLSFAIPKNAKGKLLKVKVTIKTGSSSTTRVATFRIH